MYKSMFWNLMYIENQKNLKRILLWVELALLAVFVILIFTFLYITIQGTPDNVTITTEDRIKIPQLVTWPGSLAFSLRFAAGSKLLLIIFIGAVTASEYSWRTYQLWLSRGVPRDLLLVTKFLSFCLPTILVITAALFTGGLISAIFSLNLNGDLYLDQIHFGSLGLDILRTTYTLLPYAAITFLLAIVTRSAVAAIGGCTAYGLLVESLLADFLPLLPGWFGEITKYLPANLMQSILSASWTPPALAREIQPDLLSPGLAAASIAMMTLSLLGAALWVFKRQDFSG